jgi:hypothetical protein
MSPTKRLAELAARFKQRARRYRPLALATECQHGFTGSRGGCPFHCHVPVYRLQPGEQSSLEFGSRQ